MVVSWRYAAWPVAGKATVSAGLPRCAARAADAPGSQLGRALRDPRGAYGGSSPCAAVLHLHPAAHAAIAKLLAETSKAHGTSYIVETHSKNFLLGLQDMVVDRNIPLTKDDVIIYFVDETEDGFAYLRPITINDEGDLSYWPKGVFEESSAIYDDIERKVFANREEV